MTAKKGDQTLKETLSSSTSKSKKMIAWLERDPWTKAKSILADKKYTPQKLIDVVIGSGLVFGESSLVDFFVEHAPKYADMPTPMDKSISHQYQFFMYPNEYTGFNNFCVLKDLKKNWILKALFIDGVLEDSHTINSWMEHCDGKDILKRKRLIAKKSEEKYIISLSKEDSLAILKRMTYEYDKREFDDQLNLTIKKIGQYKDAANEIEEIDMELERLNNSIKALREKRDAQAVDTIAENHFEAKEYIARKKQKTGVPSIEIAREVFSDFSEETFHQRKQIDTAAAQEKRRVKKTNIKKKKLEKKLEKIAGNKQ